MDDKIQVEDVETKSADNKKDTFAINTQLVGHLTLADHFDIDLPSKEDGDKLRLIWNYISVIDPTVDPETILLSLERRLGEPRLGESMLDKVYRWIKLSEQGQIIREKMRRVETGDNLPTVG